MKRIKIYIAAVLGICVATSCEMNKLDNYAAPDAQVYGGIYDVDNQDVLIQQDLVSGGYVEYVENYNPNDANPPKQSVNFKQDGTYRNNLMFSGSYKYFLPLKGNFVTPDTTKDVIIHEGGNEINFIAKPYCRVSDVSISQQGDKIVATCKVDNLMWNAANPGSYRTTTIGLYGHMTKLVVGQPAYLVKAEISNPDDATIADKNHVYTIEMPLTGDTKNRLKTGQTYYFRVGARVEAAESKYNYGGEVVGITITE